MPDGRLREPPAVPRTGRSSRWPSGYGRVGLGLSAWVVFGLIARAATSVGGAPTPADQAVADWFEAYRTAGLTTGMRFATGLASAPWVTAFTLIVAFGMVWQRAWHRLLIFGLIVPGGMAVSVALKLGFHRPRPATAAALPGLTDYSFPSGHTLAATLLYGGLLCLGWRALETRRGRITASLGACALVMLVGVSRLQLGVHYLSDVLGAVAAGIAWLGFCFFAARRWRFAI